MDNIDANLFLHAILFTKERLPLIRDSFRPRLHEYMDGLARTEFRGALAIGGTDNHVHGLIVLPPELSVEEAMRKWKSLSTQWVFETFPQETDFGWDEGYGVFSISPSEVSEVSAFIRGQAEHHKTMTFEDEFVGLLNLHGIQYDPEHVWD